MRRLEDLERANAEILNGPNCVYISDPEATILRLLVAYAAHHRIEGVPVSGTDKTDEPAHLFLNIDSFFNTVGGFSLAFVISAHDHFSEQPH